MTSVVSLHEQALLAALVDANPRGGSRIV